MENLQELQRKDVDMKVESLHKHWTQLKNIAKTRTDLATLYIQFLDESESLEKVFNEVELILKTAATEENLKQIEKAWGVIKPSFGEIKRTGGRVIEDLEKVRKHKNKWTTLCLLAHQLNVYLYWRISNLWKIYLCNRSRTHISIGRQCVRRFRRLSTDSVSDSLRSRRVVTTGPRS